MKQQTADVERRSRREFIGSVLQMSGALLLIQNVPVTAQSKFIHYGDTLVMDTPTIEDTVERYMQIWNLKGLPNIKAALAKWCAKEVSHSDPNRPAKTGMDNLAAVIQNSQEKFAGRELTLVSKVDYHFGSGRYNWRLTQKDGQKFDGTDYFEYDSENLITRIVTFAGVLS